jgi:hypothetical protein
VALSSITLISHRTIGLTDLRLSSTYGGLLVGSPTKEVNDRTIQYRVDAAQRAYTRFPVHLVPPQRTLTGRETRRGEPVEELPAVACMGVFDSSEIDPAHDDGWWYSLLTVVWFQSELRIPGPDYAPPGLRELAWEELAKDFVD